MESVVVIVGIDGVCLVLYNGRMSFVKGRGWDDRVESSLEGGAWRWRRGKKKEVSGGDWW